MHVHYSQNFINGLIGIGGFNFIIGLASLTTGSPAWFLLIVGAALLAIAFLLRRRPLLTIDEDRIVLHGLISPLTRTYPIDSQEDIALVENDLYVNQAGYAKRIPVAKGMIDSGDWGKLKARYGQKDE